MKIERIAIEDFRNILKADLYPTEKYNVIVGDNGSGKTSFLEALFYIGNAKSFRTPLSDKLIRHGTNSFHLFTQGKTSGDREVKYSIGVSKSKKEQTIKINQQKIKNRSELATTLPIQLVNP
ncbi:AAA family ATPase, partial [Kaarinaea lacus]